MAVEWRNLRVPAVLHDRLTRIAGELLACIERDLATMGRSKVGTLWHTDRLREREYLQQIVARLEAEEAPQMSQDGPIEPSEADRAWAAEMSEKGLMQPHKNPCRPGFNPRRGRWGKAITTWTEAGCPVPPEKS
jgi:hypothetical protein